MFITQLLLELIMKLSLLTTMNRPEYIHDINKEDRSIQEVYQVSINNQQEK